MSVSTVLFLVSIILAIVEEFQANGKSLLGWAVIATDVGLLWGHLG
jgi:hypothetical protein